MYYGGIDYYFFSGVKSYFRRVLADKEIDNKEILFVLKMKNFPFRSIQRKVNGVEKAVGIYDKSIINSYFRTQEKIDEIKRMIEKYREDDIADLYNQITSRKNFQPSSYDKSYDEIWQEAKDKNKEQMVSYLSKIDDIPEENMDYVSKQLLADDGVFNESKEENLSDVDTEWKPKEGIFLSKSPRSIANYLLKNSKDKGQAMKRLCFYMNRAGENLQNKTVLNKAKELLKSDED